MSIIERVAELLGPIESTRSKSPDGSGSNLIERVVGERAEGSRIVNAGAIAPPSETKDSAEENEDGVKVLRLDDSAPVTFRSNRLTANGGIRKPSKTHKIDRDLMRRQNLITPDDVRSPIAECFRLIKSQLLIKIAKSNVSAGSNLVMVASAQPGEGKSFCATNLAISIALEKDCSVLLVDCDVAKPTLPQVLGLDVQLGLMDVLDRGLDLGKILCKTDIGKLSLLPAGTEHRHATELLASDAMRAMLAEMSSRYADRIIIFDSPPLLAASEASALASHMGQIVMVVAADQTTEAELSAALGRVDPGKVAGLVLNKGQASHIYYGYRYGG